jgi:hypothetical protein
MVVSSLHISLNGKKKPTGLKITVGFLLPDKNSAGKN